MNTAHHMLLYGCGTPGSDKPIWNCGEMASSDVSDGLEQHGPCGATSQVDIDFFINKTSFLKINNFR